MHAFLCSLPLWVSALLVVVAPTIVAMFGPVFVRSHVSLHHLSKQNEIAGFKFATIGVIYAVLLAFAVIAVWEKFSEAELSVLQEAGSSAALSRLSSGPQPHAAATRAALANYLETAIEQDWPRMAANGESGEATRALDALYLAATRYADSGQRQPAIFAEMFRELAAVTQARRTRLHLAEGIVPRGLWAVLIVGAVLTVGFTNFFGAENLRAQVLMTGILSLVVFMGLFVIVAFDYPFSGDVHISPEPLRAVLENMGHDGS